MRFIVLGLVLLSLTSCSTEKTLYERYFSPPYTYEVEFSDGEEDFEGVLSFDGKEMTFLPNTPKGYRITIGVDSYEVEYEGIVFSENLLPSSRFLPLYEMVKGPEDCRVSKNPISLEKDNFTITFKEKK